MRKCFGTCDKLELETMKFTACAYKCIQVDISNFFMSSCIVHSVMSLSARSCSLSAICARSSWNRHRQFALLHELRNWRVSANRFVLTRASRVRTTITKSSTVSLCSMSARIISPNMSKPTSVWNNLLIRSWPSFLSRRKRSASVPQLLCHASQNSCWFFGILNLLSVSVITRMFAGLMKLLPLFFFLADDDKGFQTVLGFCCIWLRFSMGIR